MALTDKLTAIADAIRAKTGKTACLTLEQMPTEIASITTGGGGSAADVHYVTFMNGDEELYKRPVADGDDCADVVERGLIPAPTKESDVGYTYTYYGWGASDGGAADANILKNITADKTVYAIYTATVRSYTITYYDSDGTTMLKTEQVAYGTTPSYVPTKAGDTFEKWNPTPVPVTGDASYVAKWAGEISGSINGGAITWSVASNTLTIRGAGAIPNYSKYSHNLPPWDAHRAKFASVVIGEGITTIGAYAFYNFTSIVDVSFPSTLVGEAFGELCFGGCTSLTSDLIIPEGVTVVRGFSDVGSSTLVFPQSTTKIRECARMPNLKTVTIPANVIYINMNTFAGGALTSAIFDNPNGWTLDNANSGVVEQTPLNASDLSVPANAARYLTTTYIEYYWNRS